MSGPIGELDTALYNALAAGTALTGLLGGTAIYNRVAPQDANLPFVVFQYQGGGDENISPRRKRNLVYTVKALSETLSEAESIDEQIDALLHDKTLIVAGWRSFWLAREQDVAFVEVDDTGRAIFHTGAQYRIRMTQT